MPALRSVKPSSSKVLREKVRKGNTVSFLIDAIVRNPSACPGVVDFTGNFSILRVTQSPKMRVGMLSTVLVPTLTSRVS